MLTGSPAWVFDPDGIPGRRWTRRIRLRVGAMRAHTQTGWGWWYEIHDMTRPQGHRMLLSGLRHSWRTAMSDGEDTRRAVEEQLCPDVRTWGSGQIDR